MTDQHDAPNNLTWYQDRWKELMDLLPTSEPEEVVDQVRELQVSVLDEEAEALEDMGLTDAEEAKTVLQRTFERLQKLRRKNQALQRLQDAIGADSPDEIIETVHDLRDRVEGLEDQQQLLAEAGFDRPEHVLAAIASMEQQLDELYDEKGATERSATDAALASDGDTFEQLKALMAREEQLQRELGVSSPDAVIEMVRGLTEQVEDVYQDRDAARATNSVFASSPEPSPTATRLEEELGVSSPDALLAAMDELADQLEELHAGHQRLVEQSLEQADGMIQVLSSMQHQLESVGEGEAQNPVHGVNHALSVTRDVEGQLEALNEQFRVLADVHRWFEQWSTEQLGEGSSHVPDVEKTLTAIDEKKSTLHGRRDRLRAQLDELAAESEANGPAAVSALGSSVETRPVESPESRTAPVGSHSGNAPLLPETPVTHLHSLSDEALDALPAGIIGTDDEGIVRRTNANARRWPDVEADDPTALEGDDFFADVAPAADNAFFRGRFEDGIAEGEMDERFFYTYVRRQGSPANLDVRLHSSPEHNTNWIVFRVL